MPKKAVNQVLGFAIISLVVPAAVALIAFWRADASWLHRIGPIVFLAFILLMVVVDYLKPIEFRSPALYSILIPYLLLFFGAILLMGLPMFSLDWRLWLATVATTILLLTSMVSAMRHGVG